MGLYVGSVIEPIITTTLLTTRMRPGQRTVTVPTLRQMPWPALTFGSKTPKRLPRANIAGPKVSEAATATSVAAAQGRPIVLK
ncbi:Uncharacterised protein [Mycobacteroides abscessus subsp. abscessus]|nr:Uncharacterised protein [Mycobacteroides abscessus subsp. abscessus]SKS73251.1 Uncharacterised protein [Mycobacteroides abscessus subsp. abscessus]